MGKTRRPRPPAKPTLELQAVGVKDAQGVPAGKMWRPRPRREAEAPLKDAQGLAAIAVDREVEASVLEAPVVITEASGGEKGVLEDVTAVCLMDSLDGAMVIPMTRQEAVGAAGVAVGTMWRPRRPAKAPQKAVGVKADKGVAVITHDGIKASGLGAPMVGGGENGIAMCRIEALAEAPPVITTTRQKDVGVKDARGVAVEKMWRPRQPAKMPLKEVQVKDAKGVSVIAVDGKLESSVLAAPVVAVARGCQKGPLEHVTSVYLMDSLDGAPVNATAGQEAVGVKDTRRVGVGKMWRPRRPAKALLERGGVKDAKAAPVIAVEGKLESSVLPAPVGEVARGWEKGPLEDGTSVCLMGSLDRAPVNATTGCEAVGVKDAEGVAVGKMRRPRRPGKVRLERVGVKDAKAVAMIVVEGKVETSLLGTLVVAADKGGEKGPLEEGIAVCQKEPLEGAPVTAKTQQEAVVVKDAEGTAVVTVDGKFKASVLGAPVVVVAGGGEKGPLEEGIVVCQVDTLDGALVTATTQQEVVGVKDAEEVAVGKMWRPQRPAKVPLDLVAVNDAEGIAKITVVREVELLVLEDPVVAAAGGGEKGSVKDGTVVCRMDAVEGAPIIVTDEKEEVSVQGGLVFSGVDQKVDAPVVEGMQAISAKENGKEGKDKEGIKRLKHYSTAQSILIIGDGDFSFSLALATAFGSGGNLVATSLDSYGLLTIKYDKADSNVRELKRLGATVLHGIDAKTMKFHSYLEMRRFDRIVFNFPHAGFKGRENRPNVIKAHKKLVHRFFANARQLLRPFGEIHLSHKKGLPYDNWGIKKLAKKAGLIMVRKVDFSRDDYPGYNQKKGDGVTCDESFPLGPCCTFMFRAKDEEKLKQAHRNSVGLTSSCGGDNKFYPGISATDMMMPFDLQPAWPQQHFPPVQMPIAFDPCPFGAAEMGDPFNCYGTTFHHQDMVQPTYQGQPWYQGGPPIEAPWTPQEHQSLQMEYEIHRQLTLSPEYPYMESVERQAMFGNVDSSLWQTVN